MIAAIVIGVGAAALLTCLASVDAMREQSAYQRVAIGLGTAITVPFALMGAIFLVGMSEGNWVHHSTIEQPAACIDEDAQEMMYECPTAEEVWVASVTRPGGARAHCENVSTMCQQYWR